MVAKWRELRTHSKEKQDARPSSSRTLDANVSEPRGSAQITRYACISMLLYIFRQCSSSRQSSLREWCTPVKLESGPATATSNLSDKVEDHQSVLLMPKTTNVARTVSVDLASRFNFSFR